MCLAFRLPGPTGSGLYLPLRSHHLPPSLLLLLQLFVLFLSLIKLFSASGPLHCFSVCILLPRSVSPVPSGCSAGISLERSSLLLQLEVVFVACPRPSLLHHPILCSFWKLITVSNYPEDGFWSVSLLTPCNKKGCEAGAASGLVTTESPVCCLWKSLQTLLN